MITTNELFELIDEKITKGEKTIAVDEIVKTDPQKYKPLELIRAANRTNCITGTGDLLYVGQNANCSGCRVSDGCIREAGGLVNIKPPLPPIMIPIEEFTDTKDGKNVKPVILEPEIIVKEPGILKIVDNTQADQITLSGIVEDTIVVKPRVRTHPGIIPETFQFPEKAFLEIREEHFEINLCDDFNVVTTYEGDKLVAIRYPNATLAREVNWPDPRYLFFDTHRTLYYEDVDTVALAKLEELNELVHNFKSYRIESSEQMTDFQMLFKRIFETDSPFGNRLLQEELRNEIHNYYQLKLLEYQYREHISQLGEELPQNDPLLQELILKIIPIYRQQSSLSKQNIVDIFGFKCSTDAFRYYMSLYDSVDEPKKQRTIYDVSDILLAYQTYLQPGNSYADTIMFLNPDIKEAKSVSTRIQKIFDIFGLSIKKKGISKELAAQIYNLMDMTDMTERDVIMSLISIGTASIKETLNDFNFPPVNLQEKIIASQARVLNLEDVVRASELMTSQQLTLAQTGERFNGCNTNTLSRALIKLGLPRLTGRNQLFVPGDTSDYVIYYKLENLRSPRAIRHGTEYAIFQLEGFKTFPISKLAYNFVRTLARLNPHLDQITTAHIMENGEAIYRDLVKFPASEGDDRTRFLNIMIGEIKPLIPNLEYIQIEQEP
ncbi:hypothetical protein KBD45_00900 [Candidatus Dojkabacteria bacterium]|nr:hypothetical protein [Candidatus Dojkabacteria bacterium]